MTNTFEFNGRSYMDNGNGYYYVIDNGTKSRIKKAEFEEVHEAFIEKALRDTEEAMANEEVQEVLAEIKGQEKGKKKAKKRTPKNVGYRNTFGEVEVVLTDKQVDFLKHLPDTCFWEGLDSEVWVDCLCDDIGGQFAGMPMTTGAMISTLCEKGLGMRCKQKVNNRKCTSFGLTELGKKVAEDLGI